MGQLRTVRFPNRTLPTWESVRIHLLNSEPEFAIRMIDNLPAFPDEIPEDGWSELRIAFPAGMVTLRSGVEIWTGLVWGNADTELIRSRDRLISACAEAGQGVVALDDGTEVPAPEFRDRPDR